jgi:hypothetical protein
MLQEWSARQEINKKAMENISIEQHSSVAEKEKQNTILPQ